MSTELLVALQQHRIFDPRVRFDELGTLHAPFDKMHEKTDVEKRMTEAILRGERVALIGTTGNGKSSTASYVVSRNDEMVIAFQIGVTVEEPELLERPGRFAQYIVGRIAREAAEVPERERLALQIEAADSQVIRPERSRRSGGKINAKVLELSAELGNVYASIERRTSGQELVGALDHACALLRTTGAVPVLVIDDSDTWLEVADTKLRDTRRSFFGPVLQMLAERDCGLVVAVDQRYLDLDEYRPARDGHLPIEVRIPRLGDAGDLEMLLRHRVEQLDGAAIGDAVANEVFEEMFAIYSERSISLRVLMRLVHTALYHAIEAASPLIGREAFAASVREYADEYSPP